jgi:hypothetical protein
MLIKVTKPIAFSRRTLWRYIGAASSDSGNSLIGLSQ